MRYGLVSAIYVATKLIRYVLPHLTQFIHHIRLLNVLFSIFGLMLSSFLFHYFFILALLPLNDGTDINENRKVYFPDTSDGLFNLYVALTTANHPDVLMPAYHKQWYIVSTVSIRVRCGVIHNADDSAHELHDDYQRLFTQCPSSSGQHRVSTLPV